jgi:hypothetical protein
MSLTKITSKSLGSQQVQTGNIFDRAVTGPKIALNTIQTENILNGAITQSKLAPDAQNDTLPVGTVIYFAGSTPPTGYFEANGIILNRALYADLFNAIGTTYNLGDEAPTDFRLPNLKGEFIRCWDNGRMVDPGRTLGSVQFDAMREIEGGVKVAGTNGGLDGYSGVFERRDTGTGYPAQAAGLANVGGLTFRASRVVPVAEEFRPRNFALMACIKYANISAISQTALNVQALADTKLNLTGGIMTGDLRIQNGAICRRIVTQTDTANYSTGTSWAVGPTFPNITGLRAESFIRLSMHTPMRNDSASWGGGYIEPQVSYNNGTSWLSLGSSGYDGGVMHLGNADIGSYFQQFLIYPQQISNYSFRVRILFRSYDGTVMINQSHDINAISGTAPLITGLTSPNQHFCKIIVEEFL